MRFLTAGESHGESVIAILEGFPQGVKIEPSFIDSELKRRMGGHGRGRRMQIEEDKVRILSGLRNKLTMGSPISMSVKNRDHRIFAHKKDGQELLLIPRPGHTDLAGCLKYGETDVRNILERSSARETVTRVCVGAVCKQLLSEFQINIASYVTGVGKISSHKRPKDIDDIKRKVKRSKLSCIDPVKEKLMIAEIEKAHTQSDTLGGVVEIWAENVPPGLGSVMHFDSRLDGRLAFYLMSIPSIKGVEVGAGFEYARRKGSASHDAIYFSKDRSFYRKSNNSGGLEGGVSNGETIITRVGAKPIPTLKKPLSSVNLRTKKKEKAIVERSDICVVSAIGVVAESMVAIALVESFLDKFGADSLVELKRNYKNYIKSIS